MEHGVGVGVSTLAIEKERKKGIWGRISYPSHAREYFFAFNGKAYKHGKERKLISNCDNVIIHSLLQIEYLNGKRYFKFESGAPRQVG